MYAALLTFWHYKPAAFDTITLSIRTCLKQFIGQVSLLQSDGRRADRFNTRLVTLIQSLVRLLERNEFISSHQLGSYAGLMYVENSIDVLMLDNQSAFDGYRSSRGNFVGQPPTAFGYWSNKLPNFYDRSAKVDSNSVFIQYSPEGRYISVGCLIYGSGTPILRIGNGGAGATGLVEALANDYLSTTSTHGSIHWICNHSRNTQLALLGGHIDLALTYERDQEALAALEGWSITAGCAFHDHFCLLGPENDPADIRSSTHIADAFARIAKTQSLFHSRVDASATMWKERSLWGLVDLKPWDDSEAETWYKTSTSGPSEALTSADVAGAYLLSDRSTLLRQTMLSTISKSTVFYEPMGPKDILINSCYALYSPRLPTKIYHEVDQFLKYLKSARGQAVVSRFGENEVGVPFFACVEDGFAKTSLLNGRASGGRWVFKTPNLLKARL